MIGCKTCGRSSVSIDNSVLPMPNVNASNRPKPLLENDFVKMVYVGESGYVKSVVNTIAYNKRESGSIMYVHISDLQENPGLWVPIE